MFLTIFIVVVGFLFFGTSSVHAADHKCVCSDAEDPSVTYDKTSGTVTTAKECSNVCYGAIGQGTVDSPTDPQYSFDGSTPKEAKMSKISTVSEALFGADTCSWGTHPVNCMLLVILNLAGWFLNIAILLFAWVVDASKLTAILSDPAIFESWKTVRDLLNIVFILVLLFSAFATIFQVSSYNYKKILLWLVIMALLVNFSYPITRFIIDLSNSLMYTILDKSFGSTAKEDLIFKVTPQGFSDIQTIIATAKGNTTSLFASTIYIFILALTILAMGLLLLIRTIVLAILIIFSPAAFVGSVLNKGKDWWDALFKYAMAGPIMALVLAVSTKILVATNKLSDGAGQPELVSMARFIIPITILWVGITMASKGIAGSSAIIGKAQKFAKWVPNAIWKSTGVPGGFKKAADYYGKKGAPLFFGKIPGLRGSEKTERTEAWIASKLGVKGAKDQDMKKRAEDYKKENTNTALLKTKCSAGDAAACYRLAEDKDMDQATYTAFTKANHDTSLHKAINVKTKQNRADIVARHMASNDTDTREKARAKLVAGGNAAPTPDEIFVEGMSNEISKLTMENFAVQDWSSFESDYNKLSAPEQTLIASALNQAWNNYQPIAQMEGRKRFSGASVAALRAMGLPL